jgi:cytochrome c551/c552
LAETPENDPVVNQTLALYLLVAAFALLLALSWALYDEFFGLRPWKTYQRAFVSRYGAVLARQIPKQRAAERVLENSSEYHGLQQQLADYEKTIGAQVKKIDEQSALVEDRTNAVLNILTTARAYVGSQIYIAEHTSSAARKRSRLEDLADYKKGPFKVVLPGGPEGKDEALSGTFDQLEDQFNLLQQEKGKLLLQKAALLKPASELQVKIGSYVQDHLNGLTVAALQGLQAKMQVFTVDIKQINIPDMGVVDRCESCHVGIREPAELTRAEMGVKRGNRMVPDEMSGAFTSHPDPDLLQIHDPDKFGCSPCHGGNGMDIAHVEKAHGHDEHWLWPLNPKENVEAGCQQCHTRDMVLEHAATLSDGKDLFQWRGCVGCHRFEGYDKEPEDLASTERSIQQLEKQREENQLAIQKNIQAGDNAPDNATAVADYLKANELQVAISKIDMQVDHANRQTKFLLMDRKKVGPDLKEVRAKLRPEWIPVWLQNPHTFRPTTRMPRFRLDEDELPAVSAFIWQSGIDAAAPAQAPGDPVKGKESFETRGCEACHSVGEGSNAAGGWWAANLSRVGEKVNYDYLVRWIHDPRDRLAPYCPFEKRDLTPDDYKKHGLPFVFDLDHTKCPNDGHELLVEQMTPMPNLRLSWQESRDIAMYLMTLKEKEPSSYAAAAYLNDPKLKAQGAKIVERYGCAGCHEIAGMEEEGRIGTELTKEGSKPLEQMDFALYVRRAKDQGWWTHKGFFEHKLSRPEVYDDGMIKAEGEELKMPDFFEPVGKKAHDAVPELDPKDRQQINQLTTFLMGAADSQYPERYYYEPSGPAADIQAGWWVVKKYNCMGCHQFTLDRPSVLQTLPQYQTPDGKGQLPPRLLTEGARVNPDWLAQFLANPALSEKDTDRDGVRSYLKLRMPTFNLSPIEVRILVKFFQALSQQPLPYIPQKQEMLSTEEIAMARALFTSPGAPCLKCHAIGAPAHDRFATAPNFLLAQERLKWDWVKHWILDPAKIDPGTAMPSGLFKQVEEHWVFAGPTPPIFKGYNGDQAELLARYLLQLTPQEQQRLIQMSGGSLNPAPAKPATTEVRGGTSRTGAGL